MARKEWDGALVHFNLALKMTNSPVQMGRMRDEAFYSLRLDSGTAAEMAGEWGYAYTYYKQAKELRPNDERPKNGLARVRDDASLDPTIFELTKSFSGIAQVECSSNSLALIRGSRERQKSCIIWDPKDSKEIARIEQASSDVRDLLTCWNQFYYSLDSKWFAANEWEGSDAVMRFHSVKTGKPIGLIRSGDRGSQIRNFVGSPDRKHFVMQTDSFRCMLFAIDATNVNRLGEIAVHNNIIHIILFSPDGRMLISLDNFGCVVSDVETRKARFHIRVGDISCFCVSEDGKMFAASSGNTGNVCIWSLHDGNEVNRFRAHDGRITCLKISADGKTLASGGKDGTVKLWVIPSGDLLYELKSHRGSITDLDFSAQDKVLVSCGEDNRIILWDTRSGNELRSLSGHNSPLLMAKFTCGGRVLATHSKDGKVNLWKLRE